MGTLVARAESSCKKRGSRNRTSYDRTISAVDVRVEVVFQACDAETCGLPQRVSTELHVPLATLVEPDGIEAYVDRIEGGERR